MCTPIPRKKEFLDFVRKGTILPLSVEINVAGLTPVAVFEIIRTKRYPVLLESSRIDEKNGRYSYVTADPYLIFKSRGNDVELLLPTTPVGKYGRRASMKKDPLVKLRELMSNYQTGHVTSLPPFTGGAIGFFSYDFAYQFEALSRRARIDLELPESYFIFFDMVIAFDHAQNRVWVIVNPGACEQELGFRRPTPEQWSRLYDEAALRLNSVVHELRAPRGPIGLIASVRDASSMRTHLVPDLAQQEFESMIGRCKTYISDGEIQEANLSLRFSALSSGRDPLHLYKVLRESNPSTYAMILDFEELQIMSSSSEHLVRLRDGIVNSRLITKLCNQCNYDLKVIKYAEEHRMKITERAKQKHDTLLKQIQGDLDRLCDSNGAIADEMILYNEQNSAFQIVSDVQGKLQQRKDCFDLIRAVFPGGAVTGVPKLRSMEIIDELEPTARGPYAGSMGYISNSGNMDFNICVGTFIFKDNMTFFQAGTAIGDDIDSSQPYFEILRDAKVFKTAWEKL
ncbi:MAG TPA: chorismate-binding protein [Nitrospirota bacterium]|nr:chorismate-binding protein [Nitrospirota bacterium]